MPRKPEANSTEAIEVDITIEMLRVGVDALSRWDPEEEEPAAIVAEIFYSMIEASSAFRLTPLSKGQRDGGL
jgi:hypothetical protein